MAAAADDDVAAGAAAGAVGMVAGSLAAADASVGTWERNWEEQQRRRRCLWRDIAMSTASRAPFDVPSCP